MTVRISARPRGPLVIEGEGVELVDLEGKPIDTSAMRRLCLCRCGASRSKPLCDGAHNRTGFEAPIDEPPNDG